MIQTRADQTKYARHPNDYKPHVFM